MTRSRIILAGALLVSAAIGLGIGWWLGSPPPPWLAFPEVRATYVPGSNVVEVTGLYRARNTCTKDDAAGSMNPLVWRAEVVGSGPEIAQVGTIPPPPNLTLGEHPFKTAIELTEGISPDGWVVAMLVTCTGQRPILEPIRSHPVPVVFMKRK